VPDIDHRTMMPPFLRVSHELAGPGGITRVWDLRVGQPNVTHVAMPVIHSLEHFLGSSLRDASDQIVVAAPMGCQTGFYIVTVDMDVDGLMPILTAALENVLEADEVPLANSVQCGWAENHSLQGAKEVAAWLLRRSEDWGSADR
jgi:S-ribosylhomocysteine lyase